MPTDRARAGSTGREHGDDGLAVDEHVAAPRPVAETTVPPRMSMVVIGPP